MFRKIVILLFVFLFSFSMNGQSILKQKVNISIASASKKQYLDTIKSQTGYGFVYSSVVKPYEIVNLNLGEIELEQALDILFENQGVKYIIQDKIIILSPKDEQLKLIEEPRKVAVTGKVISKRNQAVQFASIFFEEFGLGTLTNSDGFFRILVPENLLTNDLMVSCIGYELKNIPPEKYLSDSLIVRLRSFAIPIKNITIRPEVPEQLVVNSFYARKTNYSSKPVLMNAFFRESSMQDDKYVSLTEAVVEINKSSYQSSADDLVRLLKGRNGTNVEQSELVNFVVEGGLYNGLRLDIAKYTSVFYSAEATQYYKYEFLKSTFYRGRQTYVIRFDSKDGAEVVGYRGKLFIDTESLALVRAEFELNSKGIVQARNILVKKTPRKIKAKPEYAKYEVEYRFYNNVWNLHYAGSSMKVKVKKLRGVKNKGYSCNFFSSSEFVVTDHVDKPYQKIKFREASKISDILVEQVKETNEQFWFDDNVILPEEPLLNTIRKLQSEGLIEKNSNTMSRDEK